VSLLKSINRRELLALAMTKAPMSPVALALEASGPDPLKDKLLSVAWSDGSPEPSWFQINDDADREVLASFLSNRPLILYDAARCSTFLRQADITPNVLSDPKLMRFALNPSASLSFQALLQRYVDSSSLEPIPDNLDVGLVVVPEDGLLSDNRALLSAVANATMLLHNELSDDLGWATPVYQQELAIVPTVTEMVLFGIQILFGALQEKISGLEAAIEELEAKLTSMKVLFSVNRGGFLINWGSPRDICELLLSLGIELKNHTPGGKLSVSKDILAGLSESHPIIPVLLEYRHSVKLLGICRTLKRFYNPATRGIHCEWIATGVPTGRFRSKNPNLQQIPDFVRSVFTARPGHYFLSIDYDQLEYRILAACAGETALVESLKRGEDIHRKTAALMLGLPVFNVSIEQRAMGKQLGYSQLYGSGPSGLAHKLNIPTSRANALLDQYFAAVPRLVAFLDTLQQRALSTGYVESYYGRRRPLPEISSHNGKLRAFGMRSAVNGFAQSTAADVAKESMIRLAPVLRSYGARMLVQLHDGLLIEVPNSISPEVLVPKVKAAAETEIEGLPLTVSASIGPTWHDLKKL
jgi:DNA polymerase I-like protein with 3'-5' exonuclease and polymerase domains